MQSASAADVYRKALPEPTFLASAKANPPDDLRDGLKDHRFRFCSSLTCMQFFGVARRPQEEQAKRRQALIDAREQERLKRQVR